MVWNDTTERQLLLCLVEQAIKPKWEVVAQQMGTGFSAEAVR